MTAVATTVAVSRGRPEVPLQVITPADVRASVRRAKKSLEAAAAEIVWQIEREAWRTLGYPSWTAMREAEYGGAAFMVPSKSRPEIVARIRASGLTQQEIADTAGVGVGTVNRDLAASDFPNGNSGSQVTNSRGQQRPTTYARTAPDDDVIDAEIVEDDEHPGGNENWHTDYANGVRNDMEVRSRHVIEYLDALAKHLPDDNVHPGAVQHMQEALLDQKWRIDAAFKAALLVTKTEGRNNRPTA